MVGDGPLGFPIAVHGDVAEVADMSPLFIGVLRSMQHPHGIKMRPSAQTTIAKVRKLVDVESMWASGSTVLQIPGDYCLISVDLLERDASSARGGLLLA